MSKFQDAASWQIQSSKADNLLLISYEADWARLRAPTPVYEICKGQRRVARRASTCAVLRHRHAKAVSENNQSLAKRIQNELNKLEHTSKCDEEDDAVWNL